MLELSWGKGAIIMANKTTTASAEAAIWERAIQFERELSATAAKALLELQFSAVDQQQLRELAAKARAGTLTSDEKRTSEIYEKLGCLLDNLHSKARRALKRRRTAS
jgi:uncharacterized membrane protein YqiK